MELIKKLGTKLNKRGNLESYGEFLCSFCFQKIERYLSSGKKQKSCGCQQNSKEHKQKNSKAHKGKILLEEHRQKISKTRIERGVAKGENNPMHGVHLSGELSGNWQGGLSFLPYPPEFNSELKQQILERDNYECQCPDCEHKSTKLDIHHIDYNKQNNLDENLITLCGSCHIKTNFNRPQWSEFYQNIMKAKI